jgi:hypothetical protein
MPTFLACVLGLLAMVAVAAGGAVLLPEWLTGTAAFGLALASGFGLGIAGFATWLIVLLVGIAMRASMGVAGVMLMSAGFLVGTSLLFAIGVATLPLLLPLVLVAGLAWSLRRVVGADAMSRAPAIPGPAG